MTWNSEEWESEDEVEGNYGALVVHDPVEYDCIHCPPFPSCENTKLNDYLCDCYSYGEHYTTCCLEWGENDPIDWNFWLESADAMKDIEILLNNVMRKVLYNKLWRTCNLGTREATELWRSKGAKNFSSKRWNVHGVHGRLASCHFAAVGALYQW